MSFDRFTLEKIRSVSLLDVAKELKIKCKGTGHWYRAKCFIHEDHSPSLGLHPETGRWCCFACGEKGDVIGLVMAHENLDFEAACRWICETFHIDPDGQPTNKFSLTQFIRSQCMDMNHSQYLDPELMKRFEGSRNAFTRAMVQTGFLTAEQMARAASRFRLSSAGEQVVFWMMDAEGRLRDGKVMAYTADGHRSHERKPCTVSWLLRREQQLPEEWRAKPCLFGLHQLQGADREQPVAVVESEKTAILCSELLAGEGFVWMATGGLSNLSVPLLMPLRGRRIILFPDTDPDGSAYRAWERQAAEATKALGHPVTVSNLLERYATPEERKRKIDLADFLLAHRSD
ncbi:MAG: DUF6371 domain-containing protein [Bacteroides sp.]